MSHSDSIRRVVDIMRLLNEGQGVTIERLAQKYEVNSRSIRRDLTLIKEIFGEVLVKEGEVYRAYRQLLWDQVLSAGELMQLSNVVSLLNLTEHTTAVSESTRVLIKRSQSVYAFKSKPFEQLRNLPLLKQLEHAIAYRQVICLSYQTLDGAVDYQLKPYKIIFLNENFYLVGVYRHDTGETVKLFRIAMMQSIKRMDKSFIHDREVDRFIHCLQTPWAVFGQQEQIIRLRVGQRIKKYFIAKDYIPSQKLAQEYENGDLLLEYRVTQFQEVEELLIKWLPHIRIIEPVALRDYLEEVLANKIQALKSNDKEQ